MDNRENLPALPDSLPNPLKLFVIEEDDGTLTLEWDENDPAAEAFGCNDWTADNWEAFLEQAALQDGDLYLEMIDGE